MLRGLNWVQLAMMRSKASAVLGFQQRYGRYASGYLLCRLSGSILQACGAIAARAPFRDLES